MLATLPRADGRFAQHFINLIDQHPGAAIRHAQMSGRFTDRPRVANSFEHSDLARANAVTVGKVKANAKARICHGPQSHNAFGGRFQRSFMARVCSSSQTAWERESPCAFAHLSTAAISAGGTRPLRR